MIVLLAAILPVLASGDAIPEGSVKLAVPRVEYRMNEASATRSPWLDANGWRIERNPGKSFYYDVPPNTAPLAAAEAFAYGANATIHTTAPAEFQHMLEFLRGLPDRTLPAMANIGVVDDGSEEAGELMNLLGRRNLLYKPVKSRDPKLDLTVQLGTNEYPKNADPNALAHKIRSQLGDEKRLLRVYGTEVVIARLTGDGRQVRLHLLNYSNRHVIGMRVRVLGEFHQHKAYISGNTEAKLADMQVGSGATEFTVPDMATYAVVDLMK